MSMKEKEEVFLGELPGIDVEGALKRLKVSKKTFVMSLKAFAEDYSDFSGKIKNALNKNKGLEVRQMLHTVRGAAGNIGAAEVEKAAGMLGTAVKEGKDNPAPLIADLETALDTVLKSIDSVISKAF